MELDDTIKEIQKEPERKLERQQIIFNILLLLTIVIMVFLIVLLIKNKDLIGKDPINYGMKLHNFSFCSCTDVASKIWTSNGIGFIHQERTNESYAQYLNFSGI